MHSHIAGPKVNIARKMRPEERRDAVYPATDLLRSGTGGSTPTTFTTGQLYAGLGYTTAFDAAIPPLAARHAHEEFHDTPMIDKGFFILIGNNHYAMKLISANNTDVLRSYAGWLLDATKGYALKVVNPGGVERWKQGSKHDTQLDTLVEQFNITPRQILTSIAQAAIDLKLPHPIHIHCNQLGIAGNWQTTLETMRALEGRRAHLTHVQFHSYGGEPNGSGFCSKTKELVEYVNSHPNISVDVGHVSFGNTTSMTGDGALGYFLHRVTGRKWFNGEIECEAGCGIVPIEYKEKSLIHALQWAIGLEWYLLMTDPWRVAFSTDHPNGGVFLAYPETIELLMNKDYRREVIGRLPKSIIGRCVLPDIDREYTLNEIAIVTRATPARLLGLPTKGHLGVGADADIAIYTKRSSWKEMFSMPSIVLKAGEMICENGEFRSVPFGPLHSVSPSYDREWLPNYRSWFKQNYSIEFENFAIDSHYLSRGLVAQKV
jgi:formylmethanofuran dehydrogenase subunit A